ncbi:MAG: 30S ribosomal protein S3 [Candidatus Fischerbacteria bacterium RBG_13_37_8]|uniref:Small ribosomal subunit protein uS3 n=1 Tax=Candidatus Fischerbacteria bacterium RBG_13_37_8 TaxID=1817863 RepID=A0A1F5VE04_9BACT|nr:MAG: 30S ribosomal protein S3 [Candidatus Fischerbacteria bacterium RBG_13_37_8]
MGQKVHPYGYRLGFNRTWYSRWFAKKEYGAYLLQDFAIRKAIKKEFYHSGISSIEIERLANKIRIFIKAVRPVLVIGPKGAYVSDMKKKFEKQTQKEVFINVIELPKPELDAQIVAENVALQLEKRVAFRRAMRRAVESALRLGAEGIKIRCKGRLNGVEIARAEWYLFGRLPLHTLKADIDYGFAEARTTYGVIGVKVWINKGSRLSYDI